jgi:hypothetical protein
MNQLVTIIFVVYCVLVCMDPVNRPRENHLDPLATIKEAQSYLKDGDLVVRLNRDPASWFIKQFNRHDKSYSHAGIVFFENGCPYVFHAINGEGSPHEMLKRDSLGKFCNPGANVAFAIYRYNLNPEETKKAKSLVCDWYSKGVRFDFSFNLNSDDRMYCSEMVSKALTRASKRILIESTQLTAAEANCFSAYTHLPYAYAIKLQLVSIDALYLNPCCRLVKEYNYRGSSLKRVN